MTDSFVIAPGNIEKYRMVENFSKVCERFSTVLFFCKKTGKTFDFFSHLVHGKLYSSKENK